MIRLLRRRGPVAAFASLAMAVGSLVAQQPLPPDQQAEVLLTAARKAHNEGNLPAAAQAYRDLLQKFPNVPQVNGARFGLGLVLLNSPDQDFAKAIESLTPVANDGGSPDRPAAAYYLGVCQRALALKELAKPNNKPAADAKFAEAHRWFAAARDLYAGAKLDDKAARARCDQMEMELRLGKVKEARATGEAFAKDPVLAKAKSRPLGLYYLGLACVLDNDLPNAGRALFQVDLKDPSYGPHAQYLLGRVLHADNQLPEASVYYDTAIADYEKLKKEAAEQLKQPDRFKNDPFEKARVEALANGPPPEFVAGATFHGAAVNFANAKFAEALTKYQAFAKDHPTSALVPDAVLRAGFCQVQLKQFDEAAKTLAPLTDANKYPKTADQALLWLGKAQLGIAATADPNNVADREAKLKTALDSLKKASERAGQLAGQNDADAKLRRADALFEYADALQTAKQFDPAAQTYEQLWNEQALPTRREELLARLAGALGAAGKLDASNQRCDEFRRTFKDGVLTPVVAFRQAENAYARAVEFAKANPNRSADAKAKFEEAGSRYREVTEKAPEFERANHARYGLGVCLTQTDKLAEAIKALESIPASDRGGELAPAAYLLADCILRTTPAKAVDAIAEKEVREKLTAAAGLLETYVSANPKSQDAPDARLKLGYCQKRLGAGLADVNERNKALTQATDTFRQISKDFPNSPAGMLGLLEKAKCKALLGDHGGALNDLRAASQGDLKQNPVAPLACLNAATIFRQQNNPTEAAAVLADARKRYESALAGDAEKAAWVPLLKYHHGVALFEAGKPEEARPLFMEAAIAAKADPLAAEAGLRYGQCQIVEGKKAVELGAKTRNEAGGKPEVVARGNRQIAAGRESIQKAADTLVARADQFKNALPTADGRARMYYEAAWANRWLAEEEVNKARDELAKATPGQPVERSKIPVQPAETRAFAAYQKLIDEYPEAAVGVDARYELGELRADRGEHADAVKLLKAALDAEPSDRAISPDLTERIRLRLGGSLYATGDFAGAASQFEAVASNAKSPYFAQALYRAGESLAAAGENAKAAEKLAPFRDKGELHNVGGISDRAVLRLGQAYLAAKNWEPARQAFETCLQRYGNGPYAADARYGFGLALQNQGKFDDAVNQFNQVIAATKAEVAAKAQVQIGHCRYAQGKKAEAATAFQLAALTYDYPEIEFAAYLEAARALAEDGKPADAEKLLQKVIDDAPKDSEWAKLAKERLGKK